MPGAGRPAAGPLPSPSADASRPVGVARLRTVGPAGLAILAGILIKLLVAAAGGAASRSAFNILDTVGSLAVAAGGAAYLLKGLGALRRRLLWRVRRKLIISYLFVGVIPAALIIAFFLLSGYLVFVNVTSYMLQAYVRELGVRAQAAADAAVIEAAALDPPGRREAAERRQRALRLDSGAASLALVPVDRRCDQRADATAAKDRAPETAGPWSHTVAPRGVPAWIACAGFSGLLVFEGQGDAANVDAAGPRSATLVVRAVAWPQRVPGYAAVVDLPVDDTAKARLRADTSIVLTSARVTSGPATATRTGPSPEAPSKPIDRPSATASFTTEDGPVVQSSISFLDFRDWPTGEPGTIQASMTVSLPEIWSRLTAGRGPNGDVSLSQAFALVLVTVGALFLFIQVAAIAMGLALAKSITGSVHELFTGTVKVQEGDFSHRIAVRARDQLGALAESFNSMTASIERLLLDVAEKKRLEEELRIAHEIQMSLLPRAPAAIPGLSIAALCVPAREVGGDYYDFLHLPDGRLAVLIADVAGKGTSAALYMAELKGLMVSLSQTHGSPRAALIAANRLIAAHLDARSFITMTYAIIDMRARAMTYVRAGHTPLLYLPGRPVDGSAGVQVLTPDGLVLGLKIDDGALFERLLTEETLPLHTGDVIVFFTDGMSEAMNAQDDCYGEHRLGTSVERHAHLEIDALRDAVQQDVQAFAGETPQHDDMTMIVVKVTGAPRDSAPLGVAVGAIGA